MGGSGGAGKGGGRENEALLLAAGPADAALGGVESLVRRARGLTSRSDLAEPAQDGRDEMRARGKLALQRFGPGPEPHMELLARRALAARSGSDDG